MPALIAEIRRLRSLIDPLVAGYAAGDRGATLLEWMETADWERVWAEAARLASARMAGKSL